MAAKVPWTSKRITLTVSLTAMGTASTRRVASPVRGRIVEAYSVLNEVIGNDGGDPTPADADVTLTLGKAGSAITGMTMIHTTDGSAVGEIQSCQPTSETTVQRGEYLSAASGGGGAVTGAAKVTFVIEQE